MKAGYRLEIAPFNKDPPKAGGCFVWLVWAVAPFALHRARSHQQWEQNTLLSLGTTSSKTEHRKIAAAILPFDLFAGRDEFYYFWNRP